MRAMTTRLRIALLLAIFPGCSVYRGPASPYDGHYQDAFARARLPDAEAVERVGTVLRFRSSIDTVRKAALQVATQAEGILALDVQDSGAARMLLVKGLEMTLQGKQKTSGVTFTKYLDSWLVVSVRPHPDAATGETIVAAAWISPKTAAPAEVPVTTASMGRGASAGARATAASGERSHPRAVDDLPAVVSALSSPSGETPGAAKNVEDPERRWQMVPQAAINEFFFNLATQLFGPERWRAKFADGGGAAPARSLEPRQREKPSDDHLNAARQAGDWTSARFRRGAVIVDAPEMQAEAKRIVDRVRHAAGEGSSPTSVYIIASPQLNAFVLPNGDMFICSGLLEALDTRDELAFVLGHELDHVFEHDTVRKLEAMRRARIIRDAIVTAVTVVGTGAGGLIGPALASGAAAATSSVNAATQMMSGLAGNLVARSASSLGGVVAESVGASIVSGHSQDAELRADERSLRYVSAAGFNPAAAIGALERLKEKKAAAELRNEPIASGFLNAEPGLVKRLGRLREHLGNLAEAAPGTPGGRTP